MLNVNMIKDITFIGSGNIASELAVKLHKSKIRIKQIYSRNKISQFFKKKTLKTI